MGARGRKGEGELAIPTPTAEIQRPDAPYDLNDEQAEEWWAVVNRMPADWFPRETHALLANYCRHVVMSRRVSQLIVAAESSDELNVEEYDRLGKMMERESRIIASLATKMRISQQATFDPKKKKPSQVKKPWEN